MKVTLFMVFSMVTCFFALAQDIPAWVNPAGRSANFPSDKYLTCFKSDIVSREADPAALAETLLKLSKAQLVEQIRVSIRTTVSVQIENINSRTREVFLQASSSTSAADLAGLKTEVWYGDKKKKDREVCVMAWIPIEDLVKSCNTGIEELKVKITRKLDLAKQLSASGEKEKSATAYYGCYPLVASLENDQAILMALGKNAYGELTDYESIIGKGLDDLRKGKELSLDEACFFIATALRLQLSNNALVPTGGSGSTILMGGIVYQDSRIGSELSARTGSLLELKLGAQKVPVTSSADLNTKNPENESVKCKFILTGSYWKEGERVKIIANVKDSEGGRIAAASQEYVPLSWFTDNRVKYLPDNYELAIARQKILSGNELPSSTLQIDVWTNKGEEVPIFSRGDTMQIFMKVNRPCYVRMIYYLSDGTKTLLADNRQITDAEVDRVFMFPDLFICDSPFGSETLQICAQTEPFKPLNTRLESGYRVILENVQEIVANTRGMKSMNAQFKQAEKRLELTTVEKK